MASTLFGFNFSQAKDTLGINASSHEYYVLRSLFADVEIQCGNLAREVERMACILRDCMERTTLDLIRDVQHELSFLWHKQSGPNFRPSDIGNSEYTDKVWKEFRDEQELAVEEAVQLVRTARTKLGEQAWKGIAWRCGKEEMVFEQPLHEVVYS